LNDESVSIPVEPAHESIPQNCRPKSLADEAKNKAKPRPTSDVLDNKQRVKFRMSPVQDVDDAATETVPSHWLWPEQARKIHWRKSNPPSHCQMFTAAPSTDADELAKQDRISSIRDRP
jgi:hypothetical protein